MAAIAEATGSVISAVLFGALAGAACCRSRARRSRRAIKRGGVGIKASLAAFAAGFEAAKAGRAGQGRAAGAVAAQSPPRWRR